MPFIAVSLMTSCVAPREEYLAQIRERRIANYERQLETAEDDRERDGTLLAGELTLQEAIDLALTHNNSVRQAIKKREKADGRLLEAYSHILPKLEAAGGYERLDEVQTIDTGFDSYAVGDRDNYNASLELTQPLFTGGNAPIAIRAARLFAYLSDETVRRAVEGVIFKVSREYYDALLAEHLIEVQEEGLQAARAHLEKVRAQEEEDVARRYDVLRAQVEVSNMQADLIRQRNEKDDALGRLYKELGASQHSEAALVDDFEYEPQKADMNEKVREAYLQRPDLYIATLKRDMQAEAVRQAKTDYLPKIEMYFTERLAKPDPHNSTSNEWGSEWRGGIRLRWSLFDGLAREGRVKQEEAQLQQEEIALTEQEEDALLEVRTALNSLTNAEQLVETQKLNLERADRALELVQAGYEEGVNTQVEVLDATAALTRARGLYYQALHQHEIARLRMRNATGELVPETGDALMGMLNNEDQQ